MMTKTLIFALTVTIGFSLNANAATFTVTTTADTQDAAAGDGICADSGGACSLRAAITEANALAGADIITLPAGTYTITLPTTGDNANVGGDFDITSPITINGAASDTTIIQANVLPNTAPERVIHCLTAATAVVINDVTIRHGNSTADLRGSGIRLETATTNVTLNRVLITNNRSAGGGGGISLGGSAGIVLNINDSTISNNSAGSSGSGRVGGGIEVGGTAATVTITNTLVTGNTVNSSSGDAWGGGIGAYGVGATVTITGSTISNNSSISTFPGGYGLAGGIYNQEVTFNVTNSSVTGNTASRLYGGIANTAFNNDATTIITDSTISNNTSLVEAGGVANFATNAIAITTINRSTISGNTATSANIGWGGGIENRSGSTGTATVNLTNCTISGNTGGFGGGIYNDGAAATVNLNYSTIASNTANSEGGGLYQGTAAGGVSNLKNNIVADNTAGMGPDIFGTITSQNYNHVESTAGGTFVAMANDVTGTDPQLGPLANNGGPTFTHRPMGGSVLLNTIAGGTSECGTTVTVDQRGSSRPVGAGCEKGSVEIQLPQLANAVSRKIHGGAGTFDVNMPLTGITGVECRGGSGNHSLVFTFNNPVVSGSASVTGGTGSVVGSPTFTGQTMTVNLSGVTNAQTVTVTLANVTDAFSQILPNAAFSASFLLGDTDGDRFVNAGDALQTRSRSGQSTDATNFRSDVNTDGSVNSGDTTIVRSGSGTSVTAPSPGEHRMK